MIAERYELTKWLWTEADFEQMGWHDVTIHALAFFPNDYEFVLDIDYILKWVDPLPGETYFQFWVAPATLVFENVNDLRIDLEPESIIQLQEVEREEPKRPRNADYICRDLEWRWVLDAHAGEITLRSTGYKQYVRQVPTLVKQQALEMNARGGVSFSRGSLNEKERDVDV